MNRAKNLSDAYRKDKDSNLYKLLQLANLLYVDLEADLNCINASRDLFYATDATLDRYAEMFGVKRGSSNDEQLRTKILNAIVINYGSPDCNSVIKNIALMFNETAENISIAENASESAVIVNGLTIEQLEANGYTSSEAAEFIRKMLPIGVNLERTLFAGSLEVIESGVMILFQEITYAYPHLWRAWYQGQYAHKRLGKEIGLQGACDVPAEFKIHDDYDENKEYSTKGFTTTGNYAGGTLGILEG